MLASPHIPAWAPLVLLFAASSHVAAAAPATTTSLPATDPWVSVNDNGVAKTVTPVLTTVSGTPTVLEASPTTTAKPTAATNTAATATNTPQATATNGGGSFPVCHSPADAPLAPFCAPSNSSTLHPGKTYYITWDSSFFDANTSVVVTGHWLNTTSDALATSVFASDRLRADSSFYAWTVDAALLGSARSIGLRLSLSYWNATADNGTAPANGTIPTNATTTSTSTSTLAPSASSTGTVLRGPLVTVAPPEPYRQPKAQAPTGAALYIGLPCVFAFIVLMVAGTCFWNRRSRHIGLGNVMSRSRFGPLNGSGRRRGIRQRLFHHGYGIGQSRRQRAGALHLDSKDAILLQARESGHAAKDDNHTLYTDDHHDSDAFDVGSLAGTPTDERFEHTPSHGFGRRSATGNAFRDELQRQEDLR